MPTPRVTMSKIRQTLQLLHSGQLSQRQIGVALGISKSTVSEIASYTRAAGLDWAQAQLLSEHALALFAMRCVLTRANLVNAGYGWLVFVNTVLIFVLAFFGLAYSIFPDIVIGRMTVWEAICTASLNVIFVGVAITLPVIVAYTVFMYRVFWGKATALKYG